MRTIRTYVDLPLAAGTELDLPAAAAEHIVRVLRLAVGDVVTLFNGDGNDYAATLLDAGRAGARVRVTTAHVNTCESPLALTLAQGIARGDKMDLVVQKATELGVARVVPLATERSEVRLDAARAAKRHAHWRAVAASAGEQCGRSRVPEILPLTPIDAWLAALADDGALRLALLPVATRSLRECQPSAAGTVLVIGPEGGLGPRDVEALDAAGFIGLRLGPRILRTETAGIAALAALQALHGDF